MVRNSVGAFVHPKSHGAVAQTTQLERAVGNTLDSLYVMEAGASLAFSASVRSILPHDDKTGHGADGIA